MKLIAHRGLSSEAPENTIEAFVLAANDPNFHGIECDIRVTKDQEFVVFHDEDLKRMAGIEKPVHEFTLNELKKIKLKSGKNIRKYNNAQIPTLKEYLDICKNGKKIAIIEIKKVNELEQLMKLVELIDSKYKKLEVIFISFNLVYLKYLRIFTDLKLQFLTSRPTANLMYDLKVHKIDVSIEYSKLSLNAFKQLKKASFEVATWTVDKKVDYNKFQKMGIDYLTTNRRF